MEIPVHSGTGVGEGQASTVPPQNKEILKGGADSASLEWGLASYVLERQGTARIGLISQPVAQITWFHLFKALPTRDFTPFSSWPF